MADISKIKPLGSNTTYNIKDNSAIANITRSGTTFTATRRDGTTFTFNQQDNNTWNSLSTSQAGYVAKAPNDTNKFLRGDATWAKVTWDNIDGKPTNFSPSTHAHATSLDIDTGTSQITLAYGEKYKLTTGGTSIIFTMPSTDDTDTHWTTHLYLGNSAVGTGHVSSDITNGNVYLRLYDETAARENIKIIGTGATSVTGKDGIITINSTDTTYTFDGIYNASTNKAATVSTVIDKINTLDGNLNNTTPGVGKTLTAFSQTNGKISATFSNISITKSQISDFPNRAGSNSDGGAAISANKINQLTNVTSLSTFSDNNNFEAGLVYTAAGSGNTISDKPSGVDAFGALSFKTANGWQGQLLIGSNSHPGVYWRTASASSSTPLSEGWKKLINDDDLRLSDSRTPKSHSHGNITNDGTLQENGITIGDGDKILITDNSNSQKIVKASISFDGATTTKALTQKGTWETFLPLSGGTITGNINVVGKAVFNNTTTIDDAIINSLLVNGNSNFINNVNFIQIPTAPTATAGTNTTQIATTEFVTKAVTQGFVANDAMVFKGLIGSNQPITQLPTSGYNAGWTYRVANAGIFAGEYCEVGDLLIAINDGPASGSSVINTDWGKVEHNIDGAVFRGSGASNSSVGSSTQPVYVNGSGIVTAITSLGVEAGGTGENSRRKAGLFYNWTTSLQGQIWSRICYIPYTNRLLGSTMILNIRHTRSVVVYNETVIITAHSNSKGNITSLSSSNYNKDTTIQIRVLVNSSGNCYIELKDSNKEITEGTAISPVYCTLQIITLGNDEPILYTSFQNGTTLPENYSVAAEVTLGRNRIVTSGIFSGNLEGNADTATTATNATQLISNNRMDYGWDGINYFNIFTSNQSAAKVNDTPFSSNTWTHILRFNHNNASGYYTDLAIPFNQNSIYYKRIAAGSLQNSTTNGGWIKVLDQLNYTSYTVTKTGSGASGTWNINISGNAATATVASKLSNTSKIGDTNKPVYFKADGTPAAINYTIATSVPSGAVFTDRYVNSAAFTDDSTNTAASPVKMTLTRAGSDTVTVTANIPKVSSSSAGVAPKGAAVSSQSQSTKFLREDGTWAAPSYTVNTNTDTLVKQTAKSDNKNYKVLFTTSDSPTSGNANEAAYDTGITINPSTHTLTATNLKGILFTSNLKRPSSLRESLNDVTLQALVNTTRANRLAFLPANQIIIEKTTNNGDDWVDAEVSDTDKLGLFSEQRSKIYLPLIDGTRNIKCGLRITITAMKYNVPNGTPETEKYNYWNSANVLQAERYCQLKEMYFWLNSLSDSIGITVQRATGKDPNSWSTIFNDSNFYMTGWPNCNYINFSQDLFGGSTNQITHYWNYRIILMTKGANGTNTMGTSSTTTPQSIMEIRGYGDTVWGVANNYMFKDHIYNFDVNKNTTFPANVTATKFIGSLQGNADTATKARQDENGNNITSTYLKLSGGTMTSRLTLRPPEGEGGEIILAASAAEEQTQAGIVIDQYNSKFRIFGFNSKDGISKINSTPLVIDPYEKTITGGYTIFADIVNNLNGVVSFVQNDIIVSNNTDWNTLVTPGCYKIQINTWGDSTIYHGPNESDSSLYSFGLLFVFKGASSDGEKRIEQIYFPHKHPTHGIYRRMHNGSNLTTGWEKWYSSTHKVQQDNDNTTDSKWRKILLNGGFNNTYNTWNDTIVETADRVYQSRYIAVQPSSGTLAANNFIVNNLEASQAVATDANKKLISKDLTFSEPTTSGIDSETDITYIAKISQNAVGKISATKRTMRSASTSQSGILKFTTANTNAQLNTLTTGSATPVDNDYYISQYSNGGTTYTSYRRPMSALWNYVSEKITNGIYWGNAKTTSAATYKAQPEVASIKINGKTAAGDTDSVSTNNVELIYDSTLKCLDFIFS